MALMHGVLLPINCVRLREMSLLLAPRPRGDQQRRPLRHLAAAVHEVEPKEGGRGALSPRRPGRAPLHPGRGPGRLPRGQRQRHAGRDLRRDRLLLARQEAHADGVLRRGLRAPQHRPEHGAAALLPEPGVRLRDRRPDRRRGSRPTPRACAPSWRSSRRRDVAPDAARRRDGGAARQRSSSVVVSSSPSSSSSASDFDRVVVAGDRLGRVERVLRAGDAVGRDVGAVARAFGNGLGALAGAHRRRCRCRGRPASRRRARLPRCRSSGASRPGCRCRCRRCRSGRASRRRGRGLAAGARSPPRMLLWDMCAPVVVDGPARPGFRSMRERRRRQSAIARATPPTRARRPVRRARGRPRCPGRRRCTSCTARSGRRCGAAG